MIEEDDSQSIYCTRPRRMPDEMYAGVLTASPFPLQICAHAHTRTNSDQNYRKSRIETKYWPRSYRRLLYASRAR